MPEKPEGRGRCRNEAESQQKGQAAAGMGYVAVADKEGTFLTSVSPVFSDEGTTAETVVKAPEAGLRAAQRKAPQRLSTSTRSDSSTGDRGVDLSRSLWTRRHPWPTVPKVLSRSSNDRSSGKFL